MNFPPRSNYTEKINLGITSGDLKGIVQLFTPDQAIKMYEDGAIEDLTEYLEDNEVWNSLPEEFTNMYKIDGKILGIAAGLPQPDLFARAIRTDWLDNLGLDMPETVDELYDVVKAFTLDDPNNTGKDDTWGMTSSGTWNLQDIFQAFDARLDHVGGNGIAWNPNTGVWEDSMLKPGMVEALTYLADMYKEGYLDEELFTIGGTGMQDRMLSGRCGTTFYWYNHAASSFPTGTKKNVPEAEYGIIMGLKGNIDKNLNQIGSAAAPYALIHDTPQGKEMINAFVNIFFGDPVGHIQGQWGAIGQCIEFDGKEVTRLKYDDGFAPKPGIVEDVIPGLSRIEYPLVFQDDPEKTQENSDKYFAKQESIDNALDSGLVYFLPENLKTPYSETYSTLSADINALFEEAIVKAITGELTPEDAIENYRQQMQSIGAQDILDAANADLGVESNMEY